MNQHILAKELLNYIKNLPIDQNLNNWVCKGKTDITYGSPNGGWDGVNGYLFEKKDKSYSFVIRSIPNDNASSYIVIESLNLKGQLYNMDLSNPRICKENQGKTYLLESYIMTVGKGKKKEIEVKNSFKSIGINSNEVSLIDDLVPDWSKTLTDILEWAIVREKVKSDLKNKIVNIPLIETVAIETTMDKSPLNQILYGPPGTGKTYNSINMAIAIANPGFNIEQDHKLVKKEYDRLEKENKILFSTFHQSMSYEDFIEGIKPLAPVPNESLNYDIQAGIFKIACARAAYLCYKKYNQAKGVSASNYTFDDLYVAFIDSIMPSIKKGQFPIYKTLTGKDVEIYEVNSQDSIKARAMGSKATHVAPLTQENLEKLYNKFKSITEIRSLDIIRDTVQVSPRSTEFYAVFRGLKEFEKSYKPDITIIEEDVIVDTTEDVEKIKKFTAGIYTEAIKQFGEEAEPVVLIIDEINRGNVSAIFGELITLIENDKRIGAANELRVKLPYSKKEFGVPKNLYIIGTMNTADRSVEALDTALRRRFSFKEFPPKTDILKIEGASGKVNGMVDDIDLEALLITINNRIEKLIDKDHRIGHSYFLKVDSKPKLIHAFKNEIIPLLEEYFFGDYGKIGLVLGNSFVEKINHDFSFADFKAYDNDIQSDLKEKAVFRITDDSLWNFSTI